MASGDGYDPPDPRGGEKVYVSSYWFKLTSNPNPQTLTLTLTPNPNANT